MTLPCVRSQTLLSSTAVNLPPLEHSLGDHYKNVIMGDMASLKPVSWLFAQSFVQAQIKEHIKAFPSQRASYAENGSIWKRLHDCLCGMRNKRAGELAADEVDPRIVQERSSSQLWVICVSLCQNIKIDTKKCDDIITYNHAPSASGWTPNCDSIAICHGVGGVIKVFCRWWLMQDECTYWFSSDGIKLYVLNNVP